MLRENEVREHLNRAIRSVSLMVDEVRREASKVENLSVEVRMRVADAKKEIEKAKDRAIGKLNELIEGFKTEINESLKAINVMVNDLKMFLENAKVKIVEDAKNEINKHVESIKDSIKSFIADTVNELTMELKDKLNIISDLEASMNMLRARLEAFESRFSGLLDNLSGYSTTIEVLKTKLSEYETTIEALRNKISEYEKEISLLRDQNARLEARVNDLEKLALKVSELEARIRESKIETKTATPKPEARPSASKPESREATRETPEVREPKLV